MPCGQSAPGSVLSTLISSNPPAYYFENWHWYGPTQAQFTALALVALGVTWIVVRKLYVKENVR
jgi:hypothetical protein